MLFSHVFIAARVFRIDPASVRDRLLLAGGLGVYLFFALSGYLLFLPFARTVLGDGGIISLARYARNRALRILPLYYAVVVVAYLALPLGAHAGDWWRYALFLENYDASTVVRLDPVIWSLVVEIQFYIALPVLAMLFAATARSSYRRAWVLLGVLALGSLALRLAGVILPSVPNVTGVLMGQFTLPTLFFFFVPGMAVALLRAQSERTSLRLPGTADAWLVASLPLWLVAASGVSLQPLSALAAFLVVGGCALPVRSGKLVNALSWTPLAAIGVASYSLYLWATPIVYAIDRLHPVFAPGGGIAGATGTQHPFLVLLAIAVPVCLLAAFASYAVIEFPFLRYRERWSNARPIDAPPAVNDDDRAARDAAARFVAALRGGID